MFAERVRRPSGRTPLRFLYHALHDQYLALVLGPGDEQLWRARKDFLRAGMCFLMVMFLSPKRTTFN